MPGIKITHELGALRKELTKTRRVLIPKATVTALNRTGKEVQSAAVKVAAADMGITQKALKKKRAGQGAPIKRSKATALVKVVEITARGRPLNLINFGARQTKKGISAKPWGKRRIFKGAWLGNHKRTVFKRVGKARQPIRGVYGPGVAKSFEDARPAALKVFRERWPINFRDALRFQMLKSKNKHLGHKR